MGRSPVKWGEAKKWLDPEIIQGFVFPASPQIRTQCSPLPGHVPHAVLSKASCDCPAVSPHWKRVDTLRVDPLSVCKEKPSIAALNKDMHRNQSKNLPALWDCFPSSQHLLTCGWFVFSLVLINYLPWEFALPVLDRSCFSHHLDSNAFAPGVGEALFLTPRAHLTVANSVNTFSKPAMRACRLMVKSYLGGQQNIILKS